MKPSRIALAAGAFLLALSPLMAMQQSGIPSKFPIPWGNSAGSAYIRSIPQNSQIGIQNCAASLTDGFPPLTFVPAAAGGCPPFGADFNGILKQVTQWSQWQAAGGPVFYDSGFSSSIGGYPKGAIVQSTVLAGRMWFNTADNNATNPDDQTGAAANWIALPGTSQPGAPVSSFSTTALPNAVIANGRTVGNASSNATNRANADTFWLFSFLWTNCPTCQLFNSSGTSVSRGTSAVADWSSNHAIATVNMNGTALIGADSQGGTSSSLLASAPIISGSRTVPSSFLGENTHTLAIGELPSITSGGTITVGGTVSVSGNVTVSAQGVGTAVNIPTTNGVVNTTAIPSPGTSAQDAPSVTSALWNDVPSLSGIATLSGSNNMTGSNTMTSQGTTDTPHNIVERSAVVYWNLAL